MAKRILIRPVITEKSEKQSEGQHKYTFIVDRKANKIEIKKAVEEMYNVNVNSVNTLILPGKSKTRNTRSGAVRGRISPFKKAVVTLPDGEEINFYGEA